MSEEIVPNVGLQCINLLETFEVVMHLSACDEYYTIHIIERNYEYMLGVYLIHGCHVMSSGVK